MFLRTKTQQKLIPHRIMGLAYLPTFGKKCMVNVSVNTPFSSHGNPSWVLDGSASYTISLPLEDGLCASCLGGLSSPVSNFRKFPVR